MRKSNLFVVLAIMLAVLLSAAACGQQQNAVAPAEQASPAEANEPAKETENEGQAASMTMARQDILTAPPEPVPNPDGKTIRIAYISKMLTNPWFVAEDNGMIDTAAKLGIEYFSIDSNLAEEACAANVDNAIAQNIDGLAITVVNQGTGPSVVEKCRAAGVALITLDDDISDHDGNPIPHVGMPAADVGVLGGTVLAEMANERGFFDEGNKVAVLQIDAAKVTVLKPRLDGYRQALIEHTPLTEADFIYVDTPDAMLENSLGPVQAAVAANPSVTHWIVGGVNDDTAVSAIKIWEEAGITKANYLACGLGGYSMSVEEWERGNDSFITVVLDPYNEGVAAMINLYNNIITGEPMPAMTLINGNVATIDNWKTLVDPDTW